LTKSDKAYDNGRDRFEHVMKKYRPMLVDDQLKLNDFGGTQYLLDSFDNEGWPGELAYYKGELYRRRGQAGDLPLAIGHYQTAISHADVPPQAHRALGYSLIKEGNKSAGKEALQRYLTLVPEASDRAMVEFSLQ
jgi:beta-barrel assembly-enhancing protease